MYVVGGGVLGCPGGGTVHVVVVVVLVGAREGTRSTWQW